MLTAGKKRTALLAWVNISVVLLLFTDYYWPAQHEQGYVLPDQFSFYSSKSSKRSDLNEVLYLAGGHFEVPSAAYDAINIGDSFYVSSTAFFRRHMRISFHKEGRMTSVKMGMFEDQTVRYFYLASFLLSVASLIINPRLAATYGPQLFTAIAVIHVFTGMATIIYLFLYQ